MRDEVRSGVEEDNRRKRQEKVVGRIESGLHMYVYSDHSIVQRMCIDPPHHTTP